MSSLQKTKNGYRIQFRLQGKTRQIPLAGAKKRAAEAIQHHLDDLLTAHRLGSPLPDSCLNWLDRIGPDLLERLQGFGLVNRASTARPMIELLDEFIHAKRGLANSTLANYDQLRRKMVCLFWGEVRSGNDVR